MTFVFAIANVAGATKIAQAAAAEQRPRVSSLTRMGLSYGYEHHEIPADTPDCTFPIEFVKNLDAPCSALC